MGVDRITVTLDEQLGRAVREAAAEAGVSVSAWLSEAATDLLRNHFLGLALDAMEQEYGPVPPEVAAEVDRQWAAEAPEDDELRSDPRPTDDPTHHEVH